MMHSDHYLFIVFDSNGFILLLCYLHKLFFNHFSFFRGLQTNKQIMYLVYQERTRNMYLIRNDSEHVTLYLSIAQSGSRASFINKVNGFIGQKTVTVP